MLGAAGAVALLTWCALRLLEVGPVDFWSEYPLTDAVSVASGSLLMAVGLFSLGRWLRGEEPRLLSEVPTIQA